MTMKTTGRANTLSPRDFYRSLLDKLANFFQTQSFLQHLLCADIIVITVKVNNRQRLPIAANHVELCLETAWIHRSSHVVCKWTVIINLMRRFEINWTLLHSAASFAALNDNRELVTTWRQCARSETLLQHRMVTMWSERAYAQGGERIRSALVFVRSRHGCSCPREPSATSLHWNLKQCGCVSIRNKRRAVCKSDRVFENKNLRCFS